MLRNLLLNINDQRLILVNSSLSPTSISFFFSKQIAHGAVGMTIPAFKSWRHITNSGNPRSELGVPGWRFGCRPGPSQAEYQRRRAGERNRQARGPVTGRARGAGV